MTNKTHQTQLEKDAIAVKIYPENVPTCIIIILPYQYYKNLQSFYSQNIIDLKRIYDNVLIIQSDNDLDIHHTAPLV